MLVPIPPKATVVVSLPSPLGLSAPAEVGLVLDGGKDRSVRVTALVGPRWRPMFEDRGEMFDLRARVGTNAARDDWTAEVTNHDDNVTITLLVEPV